MLAIITLNNQIVKLLGATENLEGLAVDYLRFYALFSIPNLIGIVLNSFVRKSLSVTGLYSSVKSLAKKVLGK